MAVARENLGEAFGLEDLGLPVHRGLLELFVLACEDMELFSKLLMALLPFITPSMVTLLVFVFAIVPWDEEEFRALCTTEGTEELKKEGAVADVLPSVLVLRLLDESMLPLLYVQCVAVLQLLLLLLLPLL